MSRTEELLAQVLKKEKEECKACKIMGTGSCRNHCSSGRDCLRSIPLRKTGLSGRL